jgi:hypothetical protein
MEYGCEGPARERGRQRFNLPMTSNVIGTPYGELPTGRLPARATKQVSHHAGAGYEYRVPYYVRST